MKALKKYNLALIILVLLGMTIPGQKVFAGNPTAEIYSQLIKSDFYNFQKCETAATLNRQDRPSKFAHHSAFIEETEVNNKEPELPVKTLKADLFNVPTRIPFLSICFHNNTKRSFRNGRFFYFCNYRYILFRSLLI